MTINLPPIGAKIRVTRTWPDGTSTVIEGVVSGHPREHQRQEFLLLGKHGVVAFFDSENGEPTVTVEVLELPKVLAKEPPSGGAAATEHTVWLHAHGGWFDGFTYSLDAPEFLTWAQLNERYPDVRVLVYDVAADAPTLPWTTDNHGDDGITVKRHPAAGDGLMVNGWALSAFAQRQLLAILARQLKPGAERDALFAAAEAGQR